MKSFFMALLVTAIPLSSFAHGTKVAMTAAAVDSAAEAFETDFGTAGNEGYLGVKAWPSGANVVVRIYVNTAAKQVDYTCVHADNNGVMTMTCKK